jgi:hypothetical protein
LRRAGLLLQEQGLDSTLEAWWAEASGQVARPDRRMFDTLVIAMAWLIWKQQNARVFGNIRDQCDVSQLVDRIHDWVQALDECESRRRGNPSARVRPRCLPVEFWRVKLIVCNRL